MKPGVNKSWALVTFKDIENSQRCLQEGITVMDVNYDEIQLRLSYSDVAGQLLKNPTGTLAKMASKHAADLAPPESDTAWIGGIPDGFCKGDIDEVNKTFAENCKQFGEVISATVRVKPGVNKSWALCTFKEPASARKCVSEGMTLPDGDGSQISLQCKISDVESNLKKGTTGALASMAKKHEEEVEAAKALMAKMWSNVRQLFCVPPHTFWVGLLTAMYGAHACASRRTCDFPACVVRADGFQLWRRQACSWRRQAGWCRAQT